MTTSGNDELNGLGYTSSQPDFDFAPKVEVHHQDEADLPALVKVLQVLQARQAYYKSTDSLYLGDLTLENQFIINKKMQQHLQELETLITSTIRQVKEKIDGTQQ